MRTLFSRALLVLALGALALPAEAQQRRGPAQATTPSPTAQPAAWPAAPADAPDAEHGRDIAANGTQGGAPPCAQCHGMNGAGNGTDAFPRIDGQSAYYLFKQLNDYASGARDNPIMGPIAQGLSETERQDVAAYFGQLPYVATPASGPPAQAPQGGVDGGSAQDSAAPPDQRLVEAGRRIVTFGIAQREVQNCTNCHGPEATGMPPAMPRLAGQWASYTQAQFQAFHDGTRKNDVAAVMRDLAQRLNADEVAAVAAYLAAARLGDAR
jgi:cytochrome c553